MTFFKKKLYPLKFQYNYLDKSPDFPEVEISKHCDEYLTEFL